MLTATYEFEIFQSDGFYCAAPYDFYGGTQGATFDELCEMVADWLKVTIEDAVLNNKKLPKPTYKNTPRYGGSNVVFSVTAGRETIETVSASEAAKKLGVTPGRISQMLEAKKLEGWRQGRNTYVTVHSLQARLNEKPKAGRPRLSVTHIA